MELYVLLPDLAKKADAPNGAWEALLMEVPVKQLRRLFWLHSCSLFLMADFRIACPNDFPMIK